MPSVDRKSDILAESFWSFETANFLIEFTPLEEMEDPRNQFEFPEDVEFARRGGAAWFTARVRVWLKTGEDDLEELATDYLGACSYRSFREFVADHRAPDPMNRNCSLMRAAKGENVVVCAYFTGMVRTAVREARSYLAARSAHLSSLSLRKVS